MDDNKRFWMVFNTHRRHRPPIKKYHKLAEAMADAEALSKQYPGQPFYVMQAIGLFELPKPDAAAK